MVSALSVYKVTLQLDYDNDLIQKSNLVSPSFIAPQYFADLMDLMITLAFLHILHDVQVVHEKLKV